MKLQRHPANPILLPQIDSDWECLNVFNPSVIYSDGLFHMHYRAQGLVWVSRIGYAVSEDGIRWNRLRHPVLAPEDSTDSRGVEDPRVTSLDGRFYMCYTAYGRDYKSQKEVKAAWAEGKDFRINDMSDPDNGRYINKDDPGVKGRSFNIRYKNLTQVCVIKA